MSRLPHPDKWYSKGPRDRAGFTRRWGIHAILYKGMPWLSFGIHVDWHTPTIDLYLGKVVAQLGRNQWDAEGRVEFGVMRGSGHTDQCLCWNR